MGRIIHRWIGQYFEGFRLTLDDGTCWEICSKISEKFFVISGDLLPSKKSLGEAQAVYLCTQVEGPSVGKAAILKIRMQVPPKYPASPDPSIRAELAVQEPSVFTQQEIDSLKYLNEHGCSVTPQILALTFASQDEDMPVPGGYLVIIMMQKVPGVPLIDFWRYDPAKREKIRRAFREGLTELLSHRTFAADSGPNNVIYDEENDKCYFVDYEDTIVGVEDHPTHFRDTEYIHWGLARRVDGEIRY